MKSCAYTVLLVEDDDAHRYLYRRFLEQPSPIECVVVDAGSADAALAACKAQPPDCIVLDYRLPDTDGVMLLPRLREITQAPVVFITAHPEPLTMTKAYRDGAAVYLSKDFLSSRSLQGAIIDALGLEHR